MIRDNLSYAWTQVLLESEKANHAKLARYHEKQAFEHAESAGPENSKSDLHGALADSHALIARWHAEQAGDPSLVSKSSGTFDSPGRFF